MCVSRLFSGTAAPKYVSPLIAPPSPSAVRREGDIETRLRRARAGAAANILTSPVGIPAKNQMGAA